MKAESGAQRNMPEFPPDLLCRHVATISKFVNFFFERVTPTGVQAVRIKSRSLHCPCGGWVGYMGGDRVKDLAVSFSARMRHRHGWFCSEVVV